MDEAGVDNAKSDVFNPAERTLRIQWNTELSPNTTGKKTSEIAQKSRDTRV